MFNGIMSTEPIERLVPESGASQLEATIGTDQPFGSSIITQLVIIKTGKFANHLARISSLMNNRYNLQILTDEGMPNRKEDQSTKSTALVRSGFELLGVEPPSMIFGNISPKDLVVVLKKLNEKREELQVPVYGPEATHFIGARSTFVRKVASSVPLSTSSGAARSTSSSTERSATSSHSMAIPLPTAPTTSAPVSTFASAPASVPAGSPMNKSKLKTKSSVDETEQQQCVEDGEENRNNLYWAEMNSRRDPSVKYGYVCLWYGGTSVQSSDTVPVLQISPRMRVHTNKPLNGVAVSSSGFPSPIVPSSVGASELSDVMCGESLAPSATSALSSLNCNELARRTPHIDDAKSMEWDTESSGNDSESEAGLESTTWLIDVPRPYLRSVRRRDLSPLDEELVNAKYAHMPEDDPYRHFLLAMLAFPEWDSPQRESYIWPDFAVGLMQNPDAQDLYLRMAQSHPLNNGVRPFADVILFLLCAEQTGVLEEWNDELYAQEQQCTDGIEALLESISEFRSSDEEVFRSTCRVADCFQTGALPPFNPHFNPSTESVVYSPDMPITAELLEEYLDQVQGLRESSIKANQLIEAPLNLEQFAREYELFNSSVSGNRSELNKHATREAISQFISSSRRQNKKLTALFTVKHASCPSSASTLSPLAAGKKRVAVVTASNGKDVGNKFDLPSSSTESGTRIGEPTSSKISVQAVASASGVADEVERLIPASAKTDRNVPMDVIAPNAAHSSVGIAAHVVSPASIPANRIGAGVGAAIAIAANAGVSTLAAAAASISARSVDATIVVHSGAVEQTVPLKYCRISTMPEDIALEILHACAYDVPRALEVVGEKLRAEGNFAVEIKNEPSSQNGNIDRIFCQNLDVALNRRLISTVELDNFHGVVNRYHNDLQKIFVRFNRYLSKQAIRTKSVNSNISSVDKAAGPYFFNGPEAASSSAGSGGKKGTAAARVVDCPFDGNDFTPRIMKEVLALFFLFYPGLDDDRIPLMTTFNSPLFRMWSNNNSIAAGVTSYGQSRDTPQANALPAKKPAAESIGRGRPRLQRSNQNSHLPNRWPPNLPAIQHNLYWLPHSNTPCLCTGLNIKVKGAEVQLNMISINSEAHRMVVMPNKVVPLNDDVMKSSSDERSVAFASALMLFVDWELSNHVPATSPLRKWYVYPEFVTKMLLLTSRWLGWRKQADRHSRAATMPRRDNYLLTLIDDYTAIPEAQHNERYYNSSYPWDDSPLTEAFEESSADESEHDADGLSGIESFSERDDDGESDNYFNGDDTRNSFGPRKIEPSKRPVGRSMKKSNSSSGLDGSAGDDLDLFADQQNLAASRKRSRAPTDALNSKNSRSKTSLVSEAEVPVDDPRSKPPSLRSFYNMFWIPRSQLPCLYYDTPENRYKDKFKIIPICCLTYHYPIVVNANTKGSIEPLQMEHLKRISDERTAEFAYALIEFARKENERLRRVRFQSVLATESDLVLAGPLGGEFEGVDDDANSLHDASILQPHELFDWPEFILRLVNQPAQWHSWRKRAERSGAGQKRHQYLKALLITQDEYDEKEKQDQLLQKGNEATVVVKESAAAPLIVTETSSVAPALQIRSKFNLFWLLRSNLPAIYYDSPENRDKDKFTVLPINCCAYQYPMQVKGSAVVIEALSVAKLAHCTDDRTHEFTLALLDFAEWELADRRAQADPQKDLYFLSDDTEDTVVDVAAEPSDLYDWPDFILQMLNSPDQWSIWRKKAERSNSRDTKRTVYFNSLVEDYTRLLSAATVGVTA